MCRERKRWERNWLGRKTCWLATFSASGSSSRFVWPTLDAAIFIYFRHLLNFCKNPKNIYLYVYVSIILSFAKYYSVWVGFYFLWRSKEQTVWSHRPTFSCPLWRCSSSLTGQRPGGVCGQPQSGPAGDWAAGSQLPGIQGWGFTGQGLLKASPYTYLHSVTSVFVWICLFIQLPFDCRWGSSSVTWRPKWRTRRRS